MSRRRSRTGRSGRAPGPVPSAPPTGGHETVETWPDGEWVVRRISGSSSTKPYRCPGCDQAIAPATPHIVAWPVQPASFTGTGVDERRHWHTACWQARSRRTPNR